MEDKDTYNTHPGATTRRETLKMITGSAAAALAFPIEISAAPQATHHHTRKTSPVPYVLKHFSAQQALAIDALSEVIIPADDHSPGAKTAKVCEYVDEIVSSSPDSVKTLWMEGLAAIGRMARDEYGQEYTECTTAQQITIMEKISRNEDQPVTLEEKFFVKVKAATIEGYYTSRIGIHQDLEYQGNTVVIDFPGCTHGEHKAE
jgi:gluconate 2-dehydrogenase subunit 3-like protein